MIIIDKKIGLFIFVIFLFSLNYASAGVYFSIENGACDYQTGNCAYLPTCSPSLSDNFALGGRLLGVIDNCGDGYYDAAFYDALDNSWSNVEYSIKSGQIAAGTNVGILVKENTAGGTYNLYAYDAYFLSCALNVRAPLLSLDQLLISKAKEMGINVKEVLQ